MDQNVNILDLVQIANFILRNTNATLTEQQLKDKFKEITGVDWQANFGNILDD